MFDQYFRHVPKLAMKINGKALNSLITAGEGKNDPKHDYKREESIEESKIQSNATRITKYHSHIITRHLICNQHSIATIKGHHKAMYKTKHS
jgi:hypothetical protein